MPNQDYVHSATHKKKLGRPPRITESQIADIVSSYTSDMPVSHSPYKTPWKGVVREASFVNVISEKICGDLAKYNVVERKTGRHEPTPLPDSLMPHFTRGYFDGDGTVYKLGAKSGDRPGHYRFAICVNERTGRFFQGYLENKGIKCSLVEDKGSSIFQLRIGDRLSKQRFVTLIYGDSQGLCLTRKKRLSDQFMACREGLKGEQ